MKKRLRAPSKKKSKWKRREERHFRRLNSSKGTCTAKPSTSHQVTNDVAMTDAACSEKSKKTEPQKQQELLTRYRLTLKPFGRSKVFDAMSWPSIKVPDNIARAVEDGVKKITQAAKKKRRSNINTSDITCATSASKLPDICSEINCYDVLPLSVTRTIDSRDSKFKGTLNQGYDAATVTPTEPNMKIKSPRNRDKVCKDFPNARAWLRTARGSSVANVGPDTNCHESDTAKPHSMFNSSELSSFIALHHETGRAVWQGLHIPKECRDSKVINKVRAKLTHLLAQCNGRIMAGQDSDHDRSSDDKYSRKSFSTPISFGDNAKQPSTKNLVSPFITPATESTWRGEESVIGNMGGESSGDIVSHMNDRMVNGGELDWIVERKKLCYGLNENVHKQNANHYAKFPLFRQANALSCWDDEGARRLALDNCNRPAKAEQAVTYSQPKSNGYFSSRHEAPITRSYSVHPEHDSKLLSISFQERSALPNLSDLAFGVRCDIDGENLDVVSTMEGRFDLEHLNDQWSYDRLRSNNIDDELESLLQNCEERSGAYEYRRPRAEQSSKSWQAL